MFTPKPRRTGPPEYIQKDMERIHLMLNFEFGFNILEGGRKREFVDARRVFVQILHSKYDLKTSKPHKLLTLTDVGNYIGITHATVINLLRNFDVLCSWEPGYREIYERVLTKSSEDYQIKRQSLLTRKRELSQELELINEQLKILEDGEENSNQNFYSQGEF